jgi:hypothetical protein
MPMTTKHLHLGTARDARDYLAANSPRKTK